MRRAVQLMILALGAGLLVAACATGPGADEPGASTGAPGPTGPSGPGSEPILPTDRGFVTPSESPPMPVDPTGPKQPVISGTEDALAPFVARARADLAKRLSLPEAEIELVASQSVTWPDGALGCPQPGMHYTQMLVDGTLIVLRAGGREYRYHSGGSRGPFLCE